MLLQSSFLPGMMLSKGGDPLRAGVWVAPPPSPMGAYPTQALDWPSLHLNVAQEEGGSWGWGLGGMVCGHSFSARRDDCMADSVPPIPPRCTHSTVCRAPSGAVCVL